eukprot:1805030-Rhodomonas_salina.1
MVENATAVSQASVVLPPTSFRTHLFPRVIASGLESLSTLHIAPESTHGPSGFGAARTLKHVRHVRILVSPSAYTSAHGRPWIGGCGVVVQEALEQATISSLLRSAILALFAL